MRQVGPLALWAMYSSGYGSGDGSGSGSGDGSGSGYGYGDGSGYGYGYGSGDGDGDGDGSGDGSGYGDGDGSGSGYGYGYGYGSGDGDGSGYGSGEAGGIVPLDVGDCAGHRVEILHADLVKVGCQTWTPKEWAPRWRRLASDNDIDEGKAAAAFEWMKRRTEEIRT